MTEYYTSLDLSSRLQDKGFKGNYNAWWAPMKEGRWELIKGKCPEGGIPAYTFTELVNTLPLGIEIQQWWFFKAEVMPKRWLTGYGSINGSQHSHKSPAEAIGLLLEWLIDNGYVRDLIGKGE